MALLILRQEVAASLKRRIDSFLEAEGIVAKEVVEADAESAAVEAVDPQLGPTAIDWVELAAPAGLDEIVPLRGVTFLALGFLGFERADRIEVLPDAAHSTILGLG